MHRILQIGFDYQKVSWLSQQCFFYIIAERSSRGALLMKYKQENKINFNVFPHFIILNRGGIQLLLFQFIDKENKQSNMSIGIKQKLSYDDFQNWKQQLYAEKAVSNDAETQKGSNWNSSTVHKGGTVSEIKQPNAKCIKLKQNIKTEAHITPERNGNTRMRTSPNRLSPPLKEKNMNVPHKNKSKHKANLTDFWAINEVQAKNVNHFKTLYTELYPSPKKRSLPYNSIHKDSINLRQASKSQQRTVTKSKKKIHFTIFESRLNSKDKKSPTKMQVLKPRKKDYIIPYRHPNSITINLFQEKENASKSKQKRSNSKKSFNSSSKDTRTTSLQKKQGVSKSLSKNLYNQQNEERLNRTLQKLQKYRFVGEYIQKWQIMQKIQGYIKLNEPQCKWPLLIVDQIFKRIREDSKFQALVSK